jgi:Holliday junction DNA helicase RuvA
MAMIAQLTGTVAHVGASACVLDVAGVGYHVLSTPSTLATVRTGQNTTLATHLVVREDALTLYGFATVGERDTFASLQAVQGVGPRLALALLSVHSPDTLAVAVASGDRKALERVPGVGAKLAARLLLELGGKLVAPASAGVVGDAREQVVEALVGLGWNAKAAQSAVTEVADQPIASGEVSDTLRAALLVLGGARG